MGDYWLAHIDVPCSGSCSELQGKYWAIRDTAADGGTAYAYNRPDDFSSTTAYPEDMSAQGFVWMVARDPGPPGGSPSGYISEKNGNQLTCVCERGPRAID